ncbi:MAG: DUF6057 family protein [Prevotella sp.]|nr:DUF6057 family protein [Prevotella sp.]
MRRSQPSILIRVVCAILFLLFTFAWLFWFQADVLAVAQHGLSQGKTHYDRSVGAIICTAVLMLIQLLVFGLTRLSRGVHALTYFPSFLLLAFISRVSYPFHCGACPWIMLAALVVWGVVAFLARKISTLTHDDRTEPGLLSRRVWVNVLQMAVMMLGVALASNTNAVDHFKARAETAIIEGNVDGALSVGKRSLETDESLAMLRIFALAQKGQLGERLFEYPVVGSSLDMLPMKGSKAALQLMPDTILWDSFGVRPDTIVIRSDSALRAVVQKNDLRQKDYLNETTYARTLFVGQYLDSLEHDSLATPLYRDYRLAGFLIDRSLDSFVLRLPRYYAINDSLPRHYREALVLYRHLSAHRNDSLMGLSSMNFDRDSLLTIRFHDFLRYDTLYSTKTERRVRSEEDFRGTYWYYYYQ